MSEPSIEKIIQYNATKELHELREKKRKQMMDEMGPMPIWKKILMVLMIPVVIPLMLIFILILLINDKVKEDPAFFLAAVITSAIYTALFIWLW